MSRVFVYATNVSYAPHGTTQQMTLGNGIVESTTFNPRLQPTLIQAGGLLALGYGYGASSDNNGNVMGQTITRQGVTWTQTYDYERLNRLRSANESGTGVWTQDYGYDGMGNRWVVPNLNSGLPPLTDETPKASDWYTAVKPDRGLGV